MGIPGLTTFIAKNSEQYLNNYELHDCALVIDGNNLAAHLYKWVSKCNSCFGGDYDIFYKTVTDFFYLLIQCNVKPYVIFDGGYETRKLKTVYSRLKAKVGTAQIVCPSNQATFKTFPLMMRDVFRDALVEMNVAHVQCEFEADDEIANVARDLKCPVLSYDSDFYIFNVLYIPFSTVQLQVSTSSNKKYIRCKLYEVKNFLQAFGGLRENMLPLFATLLGNDYIKRSVFRNFYAHIKLHKSKQKVSDQQRTIAALLKWLNNETFESAVIKILGRLKQSERKRVSDQIKRVVNGYSERKSKTLFYLGIKEPIAAPELPGSYELLNFAEDQEECIEAHALPGSYELPNLAEDQEECIEAKSDPSDTDDSESNFSDLNEISEPSSASPPKEAFIDLPNWFYEYYKRGIFPAYFMDLITTQTYYSNPQVEDFNYCDAGTIALPIIKAIIVILNDKNKLYYVSRNLNGKIQKYTIDTEADLKILNPPTFEKFNLSFPNIGLWNSFIIQNTGGNDISVLGNLPDNFFIYFLAIYWWGFNTTEPIVTATHIHALVLCALYLETIDPAVGCRTHIKFMNKHGAKLNQTKEKKDSVSALNDKELCNVPSDECISGANLLVTFFKINEKLKDSKKLFSRTTVHIYGMFQCVLQQLNYLNALLGFPKSTCRVATFYNGTFIYNAFHHLKKHNNADAYIELIFKDSPVLLHNYKMIMNVLQELLPNIFENQKVTRTRKNKCKKKHSYNGDLILAEDLSDSCEEFVHDVNNKFSVLNFVQDK